MSTQFTALVPMLPVSDVPATIAFYEQLGFEVGNSYAAEGEDAPNWAWMQNGGAHLMLSKSCEPLNASHDGPSLWLYCKDVVATHASLRDRGLDVGEISYPFYNAAGEFHVHDPDGYAVFISRA